MKFSNDRDFLQAFERNVHKHAPHDFFEGDQVLQDVALERAIARFDAKEVTVKGGYAARTIVKEAPYTKDIDILIDKKDWQKLGRGEAAQEKFCDYIFDAMEQPNADGITYQRRGWYAFVEGEPTMPNIRAHFSASLKGLKLGQIAIDAGITPDGLEVEKHSGRDYFAFADVENPVISTASKEYIVADKLTLLLSEGLNRPRDIVHASLLLDKEMDSKSLFRHMKELAEMRGVESKLSGIIEPTDIWAEKIAKVCRESHLNLDIKECFEKVNGVFDRYNGRGKTQYRIDINLDDREGPKGKEGSRDPKSQQQERGQSKTPSAKRFANSRSAPEKAESRSQTPRSNVIKQMSAREIAQFTRHELPKIVADRQPGMGKSYGIEKASPGVERASPGIEKASPGVDRATPGIEKASPGLDKGAGPQSGRMTGPGRGYSGPSSGREGGFNTGGGER